MSGDKNPTIGTFIGGINLKLKKRKSAGKRAKSAGNVPNIIPLVSIQNLRFFSKSNLKTPAGNLEKSAVKPKIRQLSKNPPVSIDCGGFLYGKLYSDRFCENPPVSY